MIPCFLRWHPAIELVGLSTEWRRNREKKSGRGLDWTEEDRPSQSENEGISVVVLVRSFCASSLSLHTKNLLLLVEENRKRGCLPSLDSELRGVFLTLGRGRRKPTGREGETGEKRTCGCRVCFTLGGRQVQSFLFSVSLMSVLRRDFLSRFHGVERTSSLLVQQRIFRLLLLPPHRG